MPEGDTLFRTARVLSTALVGRVLSRFESPLASLTGVDLTGRRIDVVEARGKNLLIFFDDGQVLHTHLMMSGSWHLYPIGEPWKKPLRSARVILEASDRVAVCFSARVVRLLSRGQVDRDAFLQKLGPDILAPGFNVDKAADRIRAIPSLAVGEAIMRQHVLAGIGNIYKSETLFKTKTNPFLPVSAISQEEIHLIVATAQKLMIPNVATTRGRRITRPFPGGGAGAFWVYGRANRPCLLCSTAIAMRRQGASMRSTYFCKKCQHVD